MTGPIRLRCLVPGCTHTRGPRKHDRTPIEAWQEWVCGEHWRAVPRAFRRVHSRSWRRWVEATEKGTWMDAGNGKGNYAFATFADLKACLDAQAAEMRLWARCKRSAIERAMGIG